MKALVGMLAVMSLMGGSAYAAPTKSASKSSLSKVQIAKAKKKKKATTPKQIEAAVAAPAPVVAQAPAPAAASAPAAQTSATPITTATAEAPVKRWSGMWDTWSEAGMQDANFGKADIEAAETVRIAYKLTPVLSASITGTFSHSWGTTSDNKRTFVAEDPYLMLAHSKVLGNLPANLKSKAYARFYPGISEGSRNKDQLGFVRGMWNIGIQPTKALSITYELQPRYYFQRYKTYQSLETRDADGTILKKPSEKANTMARLKQYANIGLELGAFSAYQNLGVDYVWFHSDPEANNSANRDVAHQENLYAETGIGYSLTDNLTLAAGVYTEMARNLLDQKDDFSIYRDNESAYFLEGTVTF
ncbi:MAG: hypothetical protein ABL958_03400 [Bdellovibrionia bacterium]